MPGVVTLENVLLIIGILIGPIGIILVALIVWCIKTSSKIGELKTNIERLGRIENDIRCNRELLTKVKEDVDRGVALKERIFPVEIAKRFDFVGGVDTRYIEGEEEEEVRPMPEYRRIKGSDVWHWCRNCSNWPTSNYDSRRTKPTSGELDNQCRSKEKEGNCRT